jgi:membrane protease YdiL (CAAX protease family)
MNAVTTLEPIVLFETTESAHESVAVARLKSRKPRVWTAFATLIVAAIVGQLAIIAGVVGLGVVTGFIMGAQGADGPAIQARMQEIGQQPLTMLLFSLIPFQLGLSVVVLLAARRSKEPVRERLGLLPQSGRVFGGFKLAKMAAFTISLALGSFILTSLFIGAPRSNAIAAVIIDGSWWTITLLGIILSVIPALVEESLFRGYLQRRFLQRWSPAVAISVSTLLFALMHIDSLQHIIAVQPLGAVTGLLAYRANSIRPGMLVHAIHNVGVVGFASLTSVLMSHIGEEELGLVIMGTIGGLGLIGLPAVVSLLRSAKPTVAVHVVSEGAAEKLSARLLEKQLAGLTIGSHLAGPAV